MRSWKRFHKLRSSPCGDTLPNRQKRTRPSIRKTQEQEEKAIQFGYITHINKTPRVERHHLLHKSSRHSSLPACNRRLSGYFPLGAGILALAVGCQNACEHPRRGAALIVPVLRSFHGGGGDWISGDASRRLVFGFILVFGVGGESTDEILLLPLGMRREDGQNDGMR
jgi:hypothetical protein